MNNLNNNDDEKIKMKELLNKNFIYSEQNSKDIQYDIYKKKEFYSNKAQEKRTLENYKDIKELRYNVCKGTKVSQGYQNIPANIINPNTPYTGLLIMHYIGSGKTLTGINIAETFIPQCQKYNTNIFILVPGPLLKKNWENAIREIYKQKYIDTINIQTKDKKNTMIKSAQYYTIMSYKSFHRRVLGDKIVEKTVLGKTSKLKNVYRKNEEGEFERDTSANKIYNLNNTLIIADEAHQLTGNEYGEAVRYIIDNSINLKVVLMTATPMKNFADNIVELLNFLRPKHDPIIRNKIFTSNENYMMKFKDGGIEYLKKMSMGYVSFARGANQLTYATRIDIGEIPKGLHFIKVIKCNMEKLQKTIYETISESTNESEEEIIDSLDRKSSAIANFVFPGFAEDKKTLVGHYGKAGIKTVINQLRTSAVGLNKAISTFLFGHDKETKLLYTSRNDKILTGKILKEKNLKHFSTKFYECLLNINNLIDGKIGPRTAFIYSNLVKVGIEIFQEILIQNGYFEYKGINFEYPLEDDTRCYYCGISHKVHTQQTSHYFRPATFITVTGHSSDDVADVSQDENKKILDNIFNHVDNANGKNIKLVLGSRVINEGISLFNIKDVHILDVHYNLGKVDQAIGRAIRFCSHYDIMTENNIYPEVNVYRYVVSLQNDKLSTEEEMYRKAELKHIMVKHVERILKQCAIDCPLNIESNITKEDIKKYKDCDTWGNFQCPELCDYMPCEYKCENEKLNVEFYDSKRMIYKKIAENMLDISTFNHAFARNEIDFSKENIKDMFIIKYTYTIDEIINHIKNCYVKLNRDLYDDFFTYKSLDELIPITENDFNNFKDVFVDKFHRPGYLIYRGKYYVFQPFEINEKAPMYYRFTMNNISNNQISLYNFLKMNNNLIKFVDIDNEQKEQASAYNYDTDYYDKYDENFTVGIIDKNTGEKKNEDVFKLREKRDKILEKKRATGVPTSKGAVCINAKTKEYLLTAIKKLNIKPKTTKRINMCEEIKEKLLFLEKYGTVKNKTKKTYVIIPSNHETLPFPYNLEDRVEYITEKLNNEIKHEFNIHVKTTIKNELPSYILTITFKKKVDDITDIMNKYNGKEVKKKWEIIVE